MKRKNQAKSRPRMTASDWMELLLDSLCCIAMAIGAMLAFDQLFRFHAEMWVMAVHAVVIVAVLALGTRRKWILPAVLGGCLVLGLLGVLITGNWGNMTAYVSGLMDWWVKTFPTDSEYYTEANIMLVQWIVHILITSFLFLCVRGIRRVWAMIVCAGILFWIIIISGFRANNLMALLWLATGMFPLMSRYASARMPWAKSQSREQRRESRKKWSKPAWYVYATAVVLTAICTLISMLLLPSSTREFTSRPLANVAEDLQNALQIDNQMYTGFEDFDLTASGLQPDADQLGGNIALDDETIVMRVVTQTPTLLKGKVYDTYNGQVWSSQTSTDKTDHYRLGGVGSTDEYYEAFDLSKPETDLAQSLLTGIGANIGMTVTVMNPSSSVLYTSGRLMSFEEQTPANTPVLFNMKSEVFINSYPQSEAYQYTFTGQNVSRWDSTFSRNVDTLLAEANKNPDLLYNSEEFQQQYLSLPAELPSIVSETAAELTKGQIRPYDMMVALETGLRENYTYSLTPGETPEGQDFVAYFLENGQGYCVHFASAMAVMARTLGVPSRMVVGYGLEQDQPGEVWYARGKNAHAWVECYFEGLGWVTFDPTADSQYANLNEDDNSVTTSATETTTTTSRTRFNETGPTGTMPSAIVDKSGDGTPAWIIYSTIMAAVVLVLIALTLLLLKRLRYSEIAYQPDVVRKRFESLGEQADYYYTDIIRQLKMLHYVPKNRETMKQFAARVEAGVGLEPDAMRLVFDIMMRWRYGKIEPTEEEVALVETAHEHLEKQLHDKFNAVVYFFRRRLML